MYRQYMKGKNIEQRVQQLAEIRRREGYMAELYSLSDTESEKFFF